MSVPDRFALEVILTFPYWERDILTKKRTLYHMPGDTVFVPTPGSLLRLFDSSDRWREGLYATVAQVSSYHFQDMSDEDLQKLCVSSKREYAQRWDAMHPETPFADNPLVWRIEFSYEVPRSYKGRKPWGPDVIDFYYSIWTQ